MVSSDILTEEEIADLKGRVDRGVEYLNKYKTNWWKCISIDHLYLRSPCDCIIGQTGLWRLVDGDREGKLGDTEFRECGFMLDNDYRRPKYTDECWRVLQEFWIIEINRYQSLTFDTADQ